MGDSPLEWDLGRQELEKQGERIQYTEDVETVLDEGEFEWLAGSLALRSW